MRSIPEQLKKEIKKSQKLKKCWICGSSNIEINHTFTYCGRQINELWAFSSLCKPHHTGKDGFHALKAVKERIEYLCLRDTDLLAIQIKYPKYNWLQLYSYLNKSYG